MKINYKISAVILMFLLALNSCTKKLDINVDPNSPSEVTEKLLLPAILANFSYEVVGGWPVRQTSLWTKHLAYATGDITSGNYRVTANDGNNFWTDFSYTDVMMNCKVLIDKAAENENPSYSAIAKVILAWNLSYVTDLFGDAPFSDAFKGEEGVIKPAYDSQEEIYKQIQTLLDEAIAEAGAGAGTKPGSEDFIYKGEMTQWQKLARTLKARFYLRLSYAPGYDAAEQATLALNALNAGAVEEGDVPTFPYTSVTGEENPWYQYAIDGKWSRTNRPSMFYVDMLKAMDDPRLTYQASKADTVTNYVGVTNDAPPKNIENYAFINPFYSAKDAPLYLLVYPEIPFIRAEAEFLKAGSSVNQAVIDAYEEGVTSSMEFYGIEPKDYKDYLNDNKLSSNADAAYEQIMTQKYIANYLQVEPYNDYRRTGYPELPINDEVYPGQTLDKSPELDVIPVRMPYPSAERQYNADNIPSEIPAGVKSAMVIPVWWDTK